MNGSNNSLKMMLIVLILVGIILAPVQAGKPTGVGSRKCKPEICDGKDNDCDQLIDEGCKKHYDSDQDSYFATLASSDTCDGGGCWSSTCSYTGNDCDDSNASINPGKVEIPCNRVDDNCNGQIDEPGCFDNSSCKELFPGTNNPTADRINVVFYGLLYTNKSTFISDAEKAVDYYKTLAGTGLTELAVYRENESKFNFWYADTIFTPNYQPVTSCTQCSSSESANYCQGLANRYVVNFCNIDFRGCAYLGGASYVATKGSYYNSWPYVFDHEFQHQFPRLYDEYTEQSLGDRPGAPNCAPDLATAKSWWGDLENKTGADGYTIGFYDGCSYVSGNYRPTVDSIMRSWRYNLGLVNERDVAKDLGVYSGTTTESTPSLQVTLTGIPGDLSSYTIAALQEVRFMNPVKEKKDQPHTLQLKVGKIIRSQGFDTFDYIVQEDFSSTDGIRLIEFRKEPKCIITIEIPLDTMNGKYNPSKKMFDLPDGSSVPFSLTIMNGGEKVKEVGIGT